MGGAQIMLWIARDGDMCPSSNYCIFFRLGCVIGDDIRILGQSGSLTWRKDFVALCPVFWD